jgi:hypothetical protein
MKTISSALATALGAPVQRPAVLVEMAFSTVQRWSSGPTISWGGNTWTAAYVGLESIRVDAMRLSGTLVIGNVDGVVGAACLSQGVQDRAIRVWAFDAAATASPDVVWICDAQGSSARVDSREVRISLRHQCELIATPRTRVGATSGFTQRMPAGTVLRINGIDYRMERAT